MIATNAVSERPAIEPLGTIGAGIRCADMLSAAGPRPASHGSAMVSGGSIVDMQSTFVQDQTARVVFVHQGDIVRGYDD